MMMMMIIIPIMEWVYYPMQISATQAQLLYISLSQSIPWSEV